MSRKGVIEIPFRFISIQVLSEPEETVFFTVPGGCVAYMGGIVFNGNIDTGGTVGEALVLVNGNILNQYTTTGPDPFLYENTFTLGPSGIPLFPADTIEVQFTGDAYRIWVCVWGTMAGSGLY